MIQNIREKIAELPKSPGIYQFIDESGDILYIGKAKNLNNRIKSYFIKEIGRGPAIDSMIQIAADIRYIETESEIEAFILESELINKITPKYNVRLKDDKSFLMVRITKEDFPVVALVRARNVDLDDKTATYFGPYPSGELLRKSMHYLRKIFPYRDCSKTKFNTYRRKGRPCIYGDIKVCTAPCVDWVNSVQYKKNISFLRSFLKGRKKEIVSKLTSEMNKYSKNKEFEKASITRDKLYALDHLKDVAVGLRDDVFDFSLNIFKRIECFDISNIGGKHAVGSMVVFLNGKADKDSYRRFKVKYTEEMGDLAMMEEILTRRFKNKWPLPDLVVIDGGETHLNVAKKVLAKFNLLTPVIAIAKGPERKKNDFYFSNASLAKYFKKNKDIEKVLIIARDEAHRFAISYYRTIHKKDIFK